MTAVSVSAVVSVLSSYLCPNHGESIDAADEAVMLAAPVTRDYLDLVRIRLVQCRVVQYQQTAPRHAIHHDLRFVPQRLCVKRPSCQQARIRVMGRVLQARGLAVSRFHTAKGALGSLQKFDGVVLITTACIHTLCLTTTA